MSFTFMSEEWRLNVLIEVFCGKKKISQTPKGANFVLLTRSNLNPAREWRILSYYSSENVLRTINYWTLLSGFKYVVIIVKNYRLQ